MDASTDSDVFSSIRFIISSRTVVMSWVEIMAVSINTAVPISSIVLPLSRTEPVKARVIFGLSMPNSVASSVSPISMM